jgi:hypothetical protein
MKLMPYLTHMNKGEGDIEMTNLETLSNCLDKLNARDQAFARSMLNQAQRKPLSSKQLYWVDKLIAKTQNPTPTAPQPAHNIPPLTTIVSLLKQANVHLKHPAIVLNGVKFSLASERAKVPGSVNVLNYNTKEWYGRILHDGKFVPGYRTEMTDSVAETMVKLADDPIKAASEYGRLTGRCCFCNLPLTDDRSTFVGYGPICAKHFGLPWGA